jgi:hypothetical protein
MHMVILRPGRTREKREMAPQSFFLSVGPLSLHSQTLLILRVKMNTAKQPSTPQTAMKPVPSAKVVRFNDTIHYNDFKVGSQYSKGEGVACRWESSNGQRRRWSWERKPLNTTDCFSSPFPAKRSIGFSKPNVSPPSVPQRKNSMDCSHLTSPSDHGPLSARKTSQDRRLQFEESAISVMALADSDSTLRHFSESDSSLATDPWSPLFDDSEHSAPVIPQRYFSDDFPYEFSSIDASIDGPDFAGELPTEESDKEMFLRQFEKSVPPPPVSCEF